MAGRRVKILEFFGPCPSKLKEFSDDNSKFDEKGKKLSKRVENTMGKGEIAHYEFLLFPQCFQKDLYCRQVKTRARAYKAGVHTQ